MARRSSRKTPTPSPASPSVAPAQPALPIPAQTPDVTSATAHEPDELLPVENLLNHMQELESQLQQVREGLTHSHRLATLGTIASIIAHEYNNILTPMVSYAQLALAKPNDAALMRKAVEKALAGSERAAHISSSLLGFAREADQKHAARLRPVIDETIACMARDPRKDGIELTVDVPDIQLAISPLNLQQVLLNLFLNARQAMRRRGGKLCVNARVEARLATISIADTGPGIPEPIRDSLFEPFVTMRQNTATGETKGTGLGLSICRDLIRAAGGSIAVESTPGQGATFLITLPLADDLFATPKD